MASVDGRVLVFAGAGASKAVSPDKFPTTQEFFEDLASPITSDPLFAFAMRYLSSIGSGDIIDIEQVLWSLQNLYQFYDNMSNSKTIAGYSFDQRLLENLFPNNNAGHLPSLSSQIKSQIGNLIGKINQIVYDLYSYEPTPEELEGNWIRLISELDGLGSKLDIFTTNYDVTVESALDTIFGEITARSWRGIRGKVRQTLDLTSWIEARPNPEGIFTKLHGSLDWKIQGDNIYVGDPVFTGDHSKQAIIYPGFKGESSAPFFQIFHEYLAQSLAESKIVIFIGFAFRDDHINRLIRENIRRECRIFVINPDKSIKLPFRHGKVKRVVSGFNVESIGETIVSALDK
jgi:hypothetical protein